MRSKSKELMLEIRDFAERFTLQNFRTPSTSEIGDALGISKATAFNYLKEMDQLGLVSYKNGELETRVTAKTGGENVSVPLAGAIPCGPPEEQIQNTDMFVSLPRALLGDGEYFILRAYGDSMVDAGIDNGDLVIVKKQYDANPGDIVAALVDGGSTLKRLAYDETANKFFLMPENRAKNYPPIEGRDGNIQGIAVKVLKNL